MASLDFWAAGVLTAKTISFRAGATVGCITVSGESMGGRGRASRMGARTSITSSLSDSSLTGFSGSGGFTFECFAKVQPLMLRNSVKSTDFLLQQDQPL